MSRFHVCTQGWLGRDTLQNGFAIRRSIMDPPKLIELYRVCEETSDVVVLDLTLTNEHVTALRKGRFVN